MKTKHNPALILLRFLIATASLFVIANAVFGQTNGVPDVSTGPLPGTTSEFWTYAIAIAVPLIVGGFKKALPAIPKWVLPISTPFVGMLLGAGLKALGMANLGWVDYAQAGALAVMIRESWSQLVVVPLKGEYAAKTKGPGDVEIDKIKL